MNNSDMMKHEIKLIQKTKEKESSFIKNKEYAYCDSKMSCFN